MRVKSLTLRNFRNIHESTYLPDTRLNFLVGKNGQGKTSYLEALGYLATLRSFRGSKSDEVIRWGNHSSEVTCQVATSEGPENWSTDLKIAFEQDLATSRTSKTAFINGKPYRSSTQYLSQRFGNFELGFHTVIFNPADHDLVRGDPSGRRNYLDQVLSAEDSDYLKILQKYRRTLEQRNAVLKTAPGDRNLLLGFTESMAAFSAELVFKRLEWLQRVQEPLAATMRQIAPRQSQLGATYVSNWVPKNAENPLSDHNLPLNHFAGQGPLPSLELIEQSFWNKFSSIESSEWRAGHSLVGPHRDDWTFLLGDQALKGHGSQGEVRSALLALKLSEIELFRRQTGHRPLFLLDDFSSELDGERRSFLLKFLNETDLQVFVTTTEESLFVGRRLWVVNGNLRESLNVDGAQPEY